MSIKTLIRDTSAELVELRQDALKGLSYARALGLGGTTRVGQHISKAPKLIRALAQPENPVKGVKTFQESYPELQLHKLITCLSAHLWAVAVLKGCRLSFWDWESDEYPDIPDDEKLGLPK